MTFVHCGPRASARRVRAQPARAEQPGQPLDLAHRRGPRLERPEPGVSGRVVTAPRRGCQRSPRPVTMLPRMTRGTSSAMTSSLPSPFCTLTTAAYGQGRPRAVDRTPASCSALVATRPKSHAGRSRPSGAGTDLGGEVRQPR